MSMLCPVSVWWCQASPSVAWATRQYVVIVYLAALIGEKEAGLRPVTASAPRGTMAFLPDSMVCPSFSLATLLSQHLFAKAVLYFDEANACKILM
jgi:hypothetical protein